MYEDFAACCGRQPEIFMAHALHLDYRPIDALHAAHVGPLFQGVRRRHPIKIEDEIPGSLQCRTPPRVGSEDDLSECIALLEQTLKHGERIDQRDLVCALHQR